MSDVEYAPDAKLAAEIRDQLPHRKPDPIEHAHRTRTALTELDAHRDRVRSKIADVIQNLLDHPHDPQVRYAASLLVNKLRA